MEAFSKTSMDLVDKAVKSKIRKPDGVRDPVALSNGSAAALHSGKAMDPKKAGETADKAAEENQPTTAETTGNEDVI